MKFRTQGLLAAAFGLASAFGLAACGGPLKHEVPSTSLAPGAEADIVADVRADQAQTLLEIEFRNFPPLGELAPAQRALLLFAACPLSC